MRIILLLIISMLISCSVSQTSTSIHEPGTTASSNQISPDNPSISLADYLKRIPGVQVTRNGSGNVQVLVRGNNTMSDQREPLFVINGVNAGFGYEHAEPLVAVTDIAHVQVLKSGQETAMYGMQGSNGVIVITTKK
jgi:TonB-dependent SusC/RagA subfamily outer membrane receptor